MRWLINIYDVQCDDVNVHRKKINTETQNKGERQPSGLQSPEVSGLPLFLGAITDRRMWLNCRIHGTHTIETNHSSVNSVSTRSSTKSKQQFLPGSFL